MAESIFITDLFECIVIKVDAEMRQRNEPTSVHFAYGHYNEVTKSLTSKGQGITTKGKKYPLIWLVMDFKEKFGAPDKDYYMELNDLQFFIAIGSNGKASTADRYKKYFKPFLYPIYQEFLYQVFASGFFNCSSPETIPHEKIDRPYWGGQNNLGDGTTNLFNDFIDAIQLRNLQLFVNEKNCL